MAHRSLDSVQPFARLCKAWCRLIDQAKADKKEKFGNDAAKAMRYFMANAQEIWKDANIYGGGNDRKGDGFIVQPAIDGDDDDQILPPSFRICLAKVAELVQLFGRTLYPDNPIRVVNPRLADMPRPELFGDPNDPLMQQQMQMIAQQVQSQNAVSSEVSRVMSRYLNYTPRELGLKWHSRKVVDEAIIKGMSLWWHEEYQPTPVSHKLVGSFYGTVDDLLLDPDERHDINDCLWVARECEHPYWQVADDYGHDREHLKKYAKRESSASSARAHDSPDDRHKGKSNELLRYWKIWSKMGLGGNIIGMDKEQSESLPDFGPYCYLVVAKDMPYPLNMPPERFEKLVRAGESDSIKSAFDWPVPFYADGRWPFTPLMFHEQPGCVWPVSHIKPGLGLLNFLNWCMGFLADAAHHSSRQLIGVIKAAEESFKKSLKRGPHMDVLEIEDAHGKSIGDLVSFIQAPPLNGDLWRIIEWAIAEFEKATGLAEVLYGSRSRSDRSATESQINQQNATTRVDDMRNVVEDAETHMARSEAFMVRMTQDAPAIAKVLGPVDAMIWERYCSDTDPSHVFLELDYEIVADSGPPPNRQTKMMIMEKVGNNALAAMMQRANEMGDVAPWNNYWTVMGELNDIPPEKMPLLQPPPPPDPNAPPPPEEQKLQAEMAMKQQEAQTKAAESQAKMELEQRRLQIETAKAQGEMMMARQKLEIEQLKVQLDQQARQAELEMERQKLAMELQAKAAELKLKTQDVMTKAQLEQEKVRGELILKKASAVVDRELAREKHSVSLEMEREKHAMGMKQRAEEGKQKLQLQAKAAEEQSKKKPGKKKVRVTKRDDKGRPAEYESSEE